jgi:hypothetical protein
LGAGAPSCRILDIPPHAPACPTRLVGVLIHLPTNIDSLVGHRNVLGRESESVERAVSHSSPWKDVQGDVTRLTVQHELHCCCRTCERLVHQLFGDRIKILLNSQWRRRYVDKKEVHSMLHTR